MTLDGLERRIVALILRFFSPISTSLLAKYVAVVEALHQRLCSLGFYGALEICILLLLLLLLL